MKIDKRITKFISKHHVMTIATSCNDEPWCASCFYAFVEEEDLLVFTSDPETRHGSEFRLNNKVSGVIVLETFVVGKIRGLQFSGIVEDIEGVEGQTAQKARKAWFRRFPPSALMNTHLWIVRLNYVKFTDNRLGFGKKLIWNKEKTGN